MKKILIVVLVLTLSLSFLMISIENSAYNKSYFMDSYNKYNIVGITGRSMGELGVITDSLINYLKGMGGDELLTPHFNEREVSHMKDVQTLFDLERMVKYICLGIAIMIILYLSFKGERALIGKILFKGLFANHIFLVFLGVLIATDFNKYFTIFHHIFFTNDLWLLNPKTDLMIQMLPEPFFSGMAIRIGLSFFVYLSILQIIGFYYLKKGRVKWRKDIIN